MYFNPIIVLFLTQRYDVLLDEHMYFNPIIVLFLTTYIKTEIDNFLKFQSYYSLIFNCSMLKNSSTTFSISILL